MEKNNGEQNSGTLFCESSGAEPEKEENKIMGAEDKLFVLFSFAVSFLFCELILFGGFGFAVPVFLLCFYPFATVFLSRGGHVFSKKSILTFLPVAALLFCFAFFDNPTLRFFNVPALWGAVMLNLMTMAAPEGKPVFHFKTWLDILKATFYWPFYHIDRHIAGFFASKGGKGRHNAAVLLVTLLVISPLLLLVLWLLASSDARFSDILNNLARLFSARFWETVLKVFFAALLTFPLFTLLFSLRRERRAAFPPDGSRQKLQALPPIVTTFALCAFSLIYVLYIVLQANYLFSALCGRLPASFTYSEYARRGFFELTAVAAINFGLIAFTVLCTKRENGRFSIGSRLSLVLIILCTLLLIVTAFSKMALYIGSLGLTPLRVYTSWFMLALGLLTVLVLIKLFRPRFAFYSAAGVLVAVLYLSLNLMNTDKLIADYNIGLYHKTGKLDTQIFYQLSDSAAPELLSLKNDPVYGGEILQIITDRRDGCRYNGWRDESFARLNAEKLMGTKG